MDVSEMRTKRVYVCHLLRVLCMSGSFSGDFLFYSVFVEFLTKLWRDPI